MEPWKPLSGSGLLGGIGALVLVSWLWLSSPDHWVRILDDANLVFHEAGHPIFGILGSTAGLYGGTLGQLAFPAAVAFEAWRRREPVGFALGLGWISENLLNIGRYMADARAQVLPLVGGGEHDWTQIFSQWHVLPHDIAIAHAFMLLAWLGIAGAAVWLASRKIAMNILK